MKNNLIPAILDSLDETIRRCNTIQHDNPSLVSPGAMIHAYSLCKDQIFDLSAINLGERILHLKVNNTALHSLFILGKIELNMAERIMTSPKHLTIINKAWNEAEESYES